LCAGTRAGGKRLCWKVSFLCNFYFLKLIIVMLAQLSDNKSIGGNDASDFGPFWHFPMHCHWRGCRRRHCLQICGSLQILLNLFY
jgi:hypothetical protein